MWPWGGTAFTCLHILNMGFLYKQQHMRHTCVCVCVCVCVCLSVSECLCLIVCYLRFVWVCGCPWPSISRCVFPCECLSFCVFDCLSPCVSVCLCLWVCECWHADTRASLTRGVKRCIYCANRNTVGIRCLSVRISLRIRLRIRVLRIEKWIISIGPLHTLFFCLDLPTGFVWEWVQWFIVVVVCVCVCLWVFYSGCGFSVCVVYGCFMVVVVSVCMCVYGRGEGGLLVRMGLLLGAGGCIGRYIAIVLCVG